MKRFLMGFFAGILLLTACSQVPSETQTPTVEQGTSTPSPFFTSTATLIPTETPTASITPLPTIPTFTPTFDVSTMVTVTPAPKAECPVEKVDATFVFDPKVYDKNFSTKILDYLNTGGKISKFIAAYRQAYAWANQRVVQQKDVTGDGIPELLFTDFGSFAAYVCNQGQYESKLLLGETYHFTQPFIIAIKDMNRDGIDEIIVMDGDDRVRIVSVFEWDKDDFKLLNPTCTTLYGPSSADAFDTNGDGTLELILKQAIPIWSEYYEGLPWREEDRTCTWDGNQFTLSNLQLAPPDYRFQAIQDGDVAASQNEFDKALSFYQQAINNNNLKSFSPEILQNIRANLDSQFGSTPPPSLTPYPEDNTEYPKLAAYAYYRIMLVHVVRGNEQDANLAFKELKENLGNDKFAQPYVEMATEFWDAYQSTHKMYDGCAAAIQYAAKHPESLIPLGSNYHGWQSHIYVPADVCPFR